MGYTVRKLHQRVDWRAAACRVPVDAHLEKHVEFGTAFGIAFAGVPRGTDGLVEGVDQPLRVDGLDLAGPPGHRPRLVALQVTEHVPARVNVRPEFPQVNDFRPSLLLPVLPEI